LVSDKSELACLADSHAAQLIWRKEDKARFRLLWKYLQNFQIVVCF